MGDKGFTAIKGGMGLEIGAEDAGGKCWAGRRTIDGKWMANVCLLTANDGLSNACKVARNAPNFVDFAGRLCYSLTEFSPRMGCGMFVLC